MLLELRIRDYAVVQDLTLELGPGLNALTGETGAGKSILVGALSLLLGERASSEVVRPGATRALVEGVFSLEGLPQVDATLERLGFPREDGLLILRREVALEGRNRAWVNGSPATAGAVGELGGALVDLHGQHEHQTLLHPEEQRKILDDFAQASREAGEVARLHGEWKSLTAQRNSWEVRTKELQERREWLEARARDVESVAPGAGEVERLENEMKRLSHAETLLRGAREVEGAVYAGDDSLSQQLAGHLRRMDELVRFDPELGELRQLLHEALMGLQEGGGRLGDYASNVDLDPGRLEELRSRLDALTRLARRFGGSLDEAMGAGRRAREELDLLDRSVLDGRKLATQVEEASVALNEAAQRLSELRASGARRLEQEVEALLPALGMAQGRFQVELGPLDTPSAHGADDVAFHVALNRGFEPRPLARVASGGELARVMLALKTVLAGVDRVPTLVFDEVDAGIGGEVANAVADTLARVAQDHQVLVVTHLAQLASKATGHVRVEKEEDSAEVQTRVMILQGEERVREVARMLGGDPESPTSREHARELLGIRHG
ncbi:MAG: DNA repair protein RecN [Gemmatimonadota bacterium]